MHAIHAKQERDAFLALYPQGYHKSDKMVGGDWDVLRCLCRFN